jgi:hypothetical protein
MTCYLFPAGLLADIDRFQAMRGALRPDRTVDYSGGLLLVLVIAAVVAVTIVLVRMLVKRQPSEAYHPQGLFRELSKAHSLDRGQERLLREVAQQLALEHPSRLFLEPNLFEDLWQQPQFAAWQSGEKRTQTEALHARLFEDELQLA